MYMPVGASTTDAQWHVSLMGDVRAIDIKEITWVGNDFTIVSEIPGFGDLGVEGTIDEAKGTVKGKLDAGEDFKIPFFGKHPK
jgi:hypothetical protein